MANGPEELAARFACVRKHLGLTQRAFGAQVGASGGYISQVEQGKRKASVDMLLGTADAYPEISRDWLLTGQGEMLARRTPSDAPVASATELERHMEAERRGAEADLGLAEIATMARLGTVRDAWRVLTLINAQPLVPTPLSAIREALAEEVEERALKSYLAFLQRIGLIEAVDDSSFLPKERRVLLLRSESTFDRHQHTLEAIQALVRNMSAIEEKRGKLWTFKGRVSVEQAEALTVEILEEVERRAKLAIEAPGLESEVEIVLSVAREKAAK